MVEKVNIFDYATSELSHDAILCWIIDGYNYGKSSLEFKKFSEDFLRMFIPNAELTDYDKVKVIKQYSFKKENKNRYIDIFVTLENSENDEKYYIVIEDKIFAGEHGDQLNEYADGINRELQVNKKNLSFVFVVIGNRSKLYIENIKNKDWHVIEREDILKKLNGIDFNMKPKEFALLESYKDYLNRLEADFRDFKIKANFDEWNSGNIQGFFKEMSSTGLDSDWGYVPNQNGGFWGMWFNFYEFEFNGFKFRIYLQLEFMEKNSSQWKVSFKLASKDYVEKGELFPATSELRDVLSRIIDGRFCASRKTVARTMTIGYNELKSTNLIDLMSEIRNYSAEFDLMKINLENINSDG